MTRGQRTARKARKMCNHLTPAERARLLAIAMCLIYGGCAYHSPAAKVTTTINVSIIPPTGSIPTIL